MQTIRYLLLLALIYSSAPFAETIYKGTDGSGRTIYSDQPFENSNKIEIESPQTYSAPPVTTKIEPLTKSKAIVYQLSIVAPEQNQTFTNEITTIDVKVNITPTLQPGDKIQLLLNGQPYGTPSESTSFTLQSLFRGAYRVQAQVISAQTNQSIAQSNEVTFYQKRPMLH
ncbi:DUF4124 domain-containing protein [Candidatus Berkiella aquae]|uniref:DUF4124 domain-containing protein n=1 Tax=Candidatus Berkiella aquae TaxID=295108 RepID=A0A0Q9YZE3_9GAMM|nr:DUF4124 domain-containing protein [Candidatus Berkiella aquae]MCS5712662.1 DUF4124 domain-containing protein [Candidatus Berkiella aquae]